ncbi:MAG: cytosolic protein [Firmicutes bacterium]|nr:cytosolic protein [Bacillota bacterium]
MIGRIMSAEEMSGRQRAEFILEMIHRMNVHHTLWFREVEHQLGFEKALAAMEHAWTKTKAVSMKRYASLFGFDQEEGVLDFLADMSEEKQLALIDDIAKNWLAQDGFWFQAVEFTEGMNDAKRCNDSTWGRFSPFEAWSVKKLLGLGEHPGLEGLEQALGFRMYGRLNVQSTRWEDGALIFEMNDCRVQSARMRKGLEDYPCKSAGLVEYARFAKGIDDRIRTTCIGCPPDPHPEGWFCAWKFSINEE